MEVSCGAALSHINNFMAPHAVIIDGSNLEDSFFLEAMRSRTTALDKTLIELPKNAEENLMWITRLDHSSLSGTFSFYFDALMNDLNNVHSMEQSQSEHTHSCSTCCIGIFAKATGVFVKCRLLFLYTSSLDH
jgi:hypothetical protein